MAKSNFSKVDEYGFERPENFDYGAHEQFMATYLTVLARRAKKWSELLSRNASLRPNALLKRYIRKGIPSEYRSRVWLATSGAELLKEKTPGLYQSLLKEKHTKEIVDSIKIDLPRTFPDNIYFYKTREVQDQLFRVLIAFAHHNRDVGYCQGMNYIAGLLLLVTKNEETAFWLLLVLIENILPQNYYSKNMAGLINDINVSEKLIEFKDREVHNHLRTAGLAWPIIATKWFVCLFAEVLPTETVLRIWDCLFFEGSKILFRVTLTLIKHYRQEILDCEDMAAIITCFKKIVTTSDSHDCHQFMKDVFKISLTRKQIEDLRKTDR